MPRKTPARLRREAAKWSRVPEEAHGPDWRLEAIVEVAPFDGKAWRKLEKEGQVLPHAKGARVIKRVHSLDPDFARVEHVQRLEQLGFDVLFSWVGW